MLQKVGLVESDKMSLISSVLLECYPGRASASQNEPPSSCGWMRLLTSESL